MRHLFIVNPVAGGKRSDPKGTIERIESFMAPRGEEYEVYETVAHMDAAEKVKREAIKGRPLRVYACGGDGTLSECAHGAAGYGNVAVTHYPCGTGNDFVRVFGEDAALFRDIGALVEGDVQPLDLIDVNGRKSVNIASVGIDARVGTDVHKYSKFLGGAGAYCMSLAVNLLHGVNRQFTITTDVGVYAGLFTLVCACNGQYYGGGFNPVREALPDDGAIDFLLVGKTSRLTIARYLKDYARGDYAKYPKLIKHIRGRHLKIEGDEEFVVSIDGEALYAKSVSMRLIPGGVNFIRPRGCRPAAPREAAAGSSV